MRLLRVILRPVLWTFLACVVGTGCARSSNPEPFAPGRMARGEAAEPTPVVGVQVSGLPLVVAGAAGQLGIWGEDFLASLRGVDPRYQRFARTLVDPNAHPDDRRGAMDRLLAYPFGRRDPYTRVYRALAEGADDPLLRAAAVRAVNRSRAPDATDLLVGRLADESVRVRLEAAKALNRLPDPSAVPALLERALDAGEAIDVRIAAVEALRYESDPRVVEALARLAGGEDFSLAWEARRTLVILTNRDERFDARAWTRVASEMADDAS